MGKVKICGYGVKVSANDVETNFRDLALNIGKVNPIYAEHIDPSFTEGDVERSRTEEFDALFLSFKNFVQQSSPLFRFYEVEDGGAHAFVIVTSNSFREVTDGDVSVPEMNFDLWVEARMMSMWAKDFLPGYTSGWIAEDIAG